MRFIGYKCAKFNDYYNAELICDKLNNVAYYKNKISNYKYDYKDTLQFYAINFHRRYYCNNIFIGREISKVLSESRILASNSNIQFYSVFVRNDRTDRRLELIKKLKDTQGLSKLVKCIF